MADYFKELMKEIVLNIVNNNNVGRKSNEQR